MDLVQAIVFVCVAILSGFWVVELLSLLPSALACLTGSRWAAWRPSC